jgi:hypothetical protein
MPQVAPSPTPVWHGRGLYAADPAQRRVRRHRRHGGSTVCAVRVVEATELLALDVFGSGARQITLSDVEHYLGQLRSHSPECRCGCCQAAAIVRPDRVLMVVRSWQRQVRATKVRGMR